MRRAREISFSCTEQEDSPPVRQHAALYKMDSGFHERYRRRLGEELRISVKLLLGLLTEGDNCIDDNSPQLERFCLVVEKAFLHGLQGYSRSFFGGGTADSNSPPCSRILLKSSTADTIWGRTKHYWDFIQNIAKCVHCPSPQTLSVFSFFTFFSVLP